MHLNAGLVFFLLLLPKPDLSRNAGLFERSNCSNYQTPERQVGRGAQFREESQGYSMGRKIVSMKTKGVLYAVFV